MMRVDHHGLIKINASSLWDGKSKELLPHVSVLIENGVIKKIGPVDSFNEMDGEVVNWSDATLMPGLIDSHTHLSMDATLKDYLDHINDGVSELTDRATAMMKRDLLSGVTTCRCLGDREYLDVECKNAVIDGSRLGPNLLIATRGIKKANAPGFVGYPFEGKQQIRQAIKANVSRGADLTKIYITGTLKKGKALESFLTYHEIEAAVKESHNQGLPVAAHCVGGVGMDWALELGLDTLEHLYHITDRQIEKLSNSGTWPVLTPGAILTKRRVLNLPAALVPDHLSERSEMFDRMSALVNAGIPYALGTDGMHGEMIQEIKYLIEMGASSFDALKAATYHGAIACGLGKVTGSLEPGKRADLIAIKGNPLNDVSVLSDVIGIMRSGVVEKSS